MARHCRNFELALITFVAMSFGQDTDPNHEENPVERMHSPYAPVGEALGEGAQYIEYLKGTLPLILAVPNGGEESPNTIPDRVAGCLNGACVYEHNCGVPDQSSCLVTTTGDLNARELAMKMRDNLVNITGHAPYLVISKLTRAKVDVDQDELTGTFNDPTARLAWRAFHHAIQEAKADLGTASGLLLDLRSHSHSLARVELGYIIAGDDLNKDDFTAADSSMKALSLRTKVSFRDLIRGENSLGGLFSKHGISTIPSPSYPSPNSSPYSSDSYTIRVHGSRDATSVDAILVSSDDSFTTNEVLDSYAHRLSVAVTDFLRRYYSVTIQSVDSSKTYTSKAGVRAAIGCATFLGCFIILALLFVARSRIRRFRVYRYERFAEDV